MISSAVQPARRILVADDDAVIRHLLTAVIKNEDYEVVTVTDGREAYRILKSDSDFTAAIFDMMMPHLEGLDIIRYMRTENRLKRIPVMMITSEKSLTLMAESLAAGTTLFLPKPFTTEQLQSMLRMLISQVPKPAPARITLSTNAIRPLQVEPVRR
jgi:DNA-binding response OmpR family regulator